MSLRFNGATGELGIVILTNQAGLGTGVAGFPDAEVVAITAAPGLSIFGIEPPITGDTPIGQRLKLFFLEPASAALMLVNQSGSATNAQYRMRLEDGANIGSIEVQPQSGFLARYRSSAWWIYALSASDVRRIVADLDTTYLRLDGSFSMQGDLDLDGNNLLNAGNIQGGSRVPVLEWGNNGVTATTTTRFLTPGYTDSIAPTSVIQMRMSGQGQLSNLRVRQNTGAGNGNLIVYTVRINGVATALLVSMASTANDGSDLVNSVPYADGDLIDIRVTKAVAVGTSPSDIVATVDFSYV